MHFDFILGPLKVCLNKTFISNILVGVIRDNSFKYNREYTFNKTFYVFIILTIPFFGIQESLGKWVVFNFESCNLKEEITDVSQSVIMLCA